MITGFAITKVCYYDNEKRDSIKCVKAGRFTSRDGKVIDEIGKLVSWSKEQIIGMVIDPSEGTRVYTASGKDDVLYLGPEVEVYPAEYPKYIRTKGDNSERDNLDKLPVYQSHV